MYDLLLFSCDNDHSVKVYSGDPYYPEYVECPECEEMMEDPEYKPST